MRLARELQPRFIFLENVAAIISRGLDEVTRALAQAGYDARWCCLSASVVGAPHKRERWFCLAFNAEKNRSSEIGQISQRATSEPRGIHLIADSYKNRRRKDLKKSGRKDELRSKNAKIPKPEPHSSNPIWTGAYWKVEPPVGRVVDGLSYRLDRNERLGNAVVPLQARKAFELLMFGYTSIE
jgi:site-specific DNA-cytosine methylase